MATIRAHHEAGHSLLLNQINVINPELVRCNQRIYLTNLPVESHPRFARSSLPEPQT
ncbi:MAG: hypothetical protein KF712_15815 [Akkermansiaceae bacterium]|nr:hypothetical protein [Akkermansiaceae bacterium]